MKRVVNVVQVLAALAAVVFLIALFANEPSRGGGGGGGGDGGGDDAAVDAGAVDGADVFSSSCAGCHGSDGGGGRGPQLSEGRAVERFPDIADQIAVVTDGRGGMPSFDGRLTPEEIEAVVVFTREGLG